MPSPTNHRMRLFARLASGAGSRPPGEQVECAMNIGLQEQRKRLRFGVVTLAAASVIAIALIATGLDRWWRLALFLLFASGAVGIFQALDKT